MTPSSSTLQSAVRPRGDLAATNTTRVLVVDDHARARQSMAFILRQAGHDVRCCSSAVEALETLRNEVFDVILTDLMMPGMNGIEFIRHLEQRQLDAQIVMVTAHATVNTAVQAMRHGAFDYIEKPFDADQLERLVLRASSHVDGGRPRCSMPDENGAAELIGDSLAMRQLKQRMQRAAPTDETVLITGESGTGKELVARGVHALSRRATGPLVSLNCPALSPQLMESELFGHERGAFTSADAPRIGRFELAHEGSILLDEVTEIDLGLQAKLLRVLQEKTIERVGSNQTRHVDARVLASTNRDLRGQVDEGQFREDLYFRLAVVPIVVPPLRERREDVPQLIGHFLNNVASRLERPAPELDRGAHDLLLHYHWPGNVRELENIITRASVLGDQRVGADQIRPWLIDADPHANPSSPSSPAEHQPNAMPVGMSLQEMERQMIEATLQQFDSHRGKTAQALGIGVRTLANKLRSYGYAPRACAASID